MENTSEEKEEKEEKEMKEMKKDVKLEGEEAAESENLGADTAQNTADSEDNVVELKPENSEAEAKKEDFKEKYYYLAAEMQNMQRRFDKERDNLFKFGSEKIMKDLVGIIDNFDRTLGFIKDDEDEKIKSIADGIEMVNKLFLETLEKHGLKKIEALGQEFDPHYHEALAQQPAEGKKEMEVIQVYENGYTLNDRVIRAAKVVVAKE